MLGLLVRVCVRLVWKCFSVVVFGLGLLCVLVVGVMVGVGVGVVGSIVVMLVGFVVGVGEGVVIIGVVVIGVVLFICRFCRFRLISSFSVVEFSVVMVMWCSVLCWVLVCMCVLMLLGR